MLGSGVWAPSLGSVALGAGSSPGDDLTAWEGDASLGCLFTIIKGLSGVSVGEQSPSLRTYVYALCRKRVF